MVSAVYALDINIRSTVGNYHTVLGSFLLWKLESLSLGSNLAASFSFSFVVPESWNLEFHSEGIDSDLIEA